MLWYVQVRVVQTGFLCLDFGLASPARSPRGSGSGPVHDLWSGWVIAPIFVRPGSTTHHDTIACMWHRVKCNWDRAQQVWAFGKVFNLCIFQRFLFGFFNIFSTHLLLISVMAGLNKTRKLSNGQVRNQEKYLNGWQKVSKNLRLTNFMNRLHTQYT